MAKVESIHVAKGWGSETWYVNKPEYCGKLLYFIVGKRCSWHYHKLKDETFSLFSGSIELTYGWDDDITKAEKLILNPGDCFHVPIGLRHQMYAITESNLLEFSTLHLDSDSIRITKGD